MGRIGFGALEKAMQIHPPSLESLRSRRQQRILCLACVTNVSPVISCHNDDDFSGGSGNLSINIKGLRLFCNRRWHCISIFSIINDSAALAKYDPHAPNRLEREGTFHVFWCFGASPMCSSPADSAKFCDNMQFLPRTCRK